MCGVMSSAKALDRSNLVFKINALILDYLKIKPSEYVTQDEINNYSNEIIAFWNNYSDKLVCSIEENDCYCVIRNPQSVLKRAISLNLYYEIYFGYLMKFGPGKIDFNTIEIVNGERETILDYINTIISHEKFDEFYEQKNVLRLREGLIHHFHAIKAIDIPKVPN
jgi:hypothetical protein